MVMEKQLVIKKQLISFTELESAHIGEGIVFLHGWRSKKEIWNKTIEDLKFQSKDVNIYALDLPGFGKSPDPKTDFTVGDFAGLVKGFAEELGLKNIIIIGHSFGGRVAIKLAAQTPSLVKKLVLVDSAGFAPRSGKKKLFKSIANITKFLFQPGFMQPLRKWVYQMIGAEDYLATPSLQKTFVNVTNEDLSRDMEKISNPTLIVYGENDSDTPAEYGNRMHKLISNSKLQFIKNAGHFSFLDQPEEFGKILQEFIR
jgi:pimeloyl-ACP methyl ester carboxylesterase